MKTIKEIPNNCIYSYDYDNHTNHENLLRRDQTQNRKNALDESGYTAGHENVERAHLHALKYQILGFGGWAVILPILEEDLQNILERGVLIDGMNHQLKIGKPGGCHQNSLKIWAKNSDRYTMMTGYALSEDGVWRQHSWVYDHKKEVVIETTVTRVAYYGFAMTNDEAEEMYTHDSLH